MLVIKGFDELGRCPEIGDKVKIVSKRKGHFWNSAGEMDKHLGSTLTVVGVHKSISSSDYEVKLSENVVGRYDDVRRWVWFPWMIEGLVIEEIDDILDDPATWASGDALEALLT